MSAHDPFDGIYDQAPRTADRGVEHTAEQPAEYTHSQLEGMRKAELQELARERGVDTDGTRDELIERIETT